MSVSPSSTCDVRRRDAELLGDDLRVGGLVSLPLRLRAEARDRLAGRDGRGSRRVEHLDAEDVEVLRRPGADDLGEARDADAHQLAALALLGLLLSQLGVADHLHRLLQRRRRSCRCRTPSRAPTCTGTCSGGMKFFMRSSAGSIFSFCASTSTIALDRVHRLGDAERAAIGDAARRLVRVDAVDLGRTRA